MAQHTLGRRQEARRDFSLENYIERCRSEGDDAISNVNLDDTLVSMRVRDGPMQRPI